MIYWILWMTFFKIGLFSFGGGYAMIPLIQKEIISHGWLEVSRFIDIIAIAQMTPGAIAVNSATYVGNVTNGVFGGIIATIGVATPSFVIGQIIAHYHEKYKKSKLTKLVFYGIRPVVAGLILSACFVVAKTVSIDLDLLRKFDLNGINIKSIGISILIWYLLTKKKVHPILLIILSSILGILLFYVV